MRARWRRLTSETKGEARGIKEDLMYNQFVLWMSPIHNKRRLLRSRTHYRFFCFPFRFIATSHSEIDFTPPIIICDTVCPDMDAMLYQARVVPLSEQLRRIGSLFVSGLRSLPLCIRDMWRPLCKALVWSLITNIGFFINRYYGAFYLIRREIKSRYRIRF